MFASNKLAAAVRYAVFGAAAASTIAALPAHAEEAGAEDKAERIQVTGSRIKRVDMEGSTPVQILDFQKMKDSAQLTVADVLRQTPANAFGSFVETSGSSAQSNATINLRGLGSDRTLVMVDGKRVPGSPSLAAASANLNMIPMAMVERIEIMTDGGGAVYGSDAIAGVVNIITKKDYEGVTFDVSVGRPTEDGGDENTWSLVMGSSNDKGNITFAVERQRRDPIADADRDYTAAKAEDLNGDGVIQIYEETEGYSFYGATIVNPDTGALEASPMCDTLASTVEGFYGTMEYSGAGEVCAYAYGNISTNRASQDRTSILVNANYELLDDLILDVRASSVKNESYGRYAPAAAGFPNIPVGSDHNPYDVEIDGYFRWYALGPRENTFTDDSRDFMASLTYIVNDNVEVDFFAHWNKYKTFDIGNTYIDYAGLTIALDEGVDLGDPDIANEYLAATTTTESANDFVEYGGGVTLNDLFELEGGAVGAYIGFNYHEIEFESLADKNSAAGWIGGGSGGDSFGDRDATAVFGEIVLPVLEGLEINAAVRYDDYSDVGSEVSPKVSVRWQAMENMVVRASYGKGFRAPSMDELYGLEAYSAAFAVDYVFCDANGIDPCNEAQYDTYISSNSELDPETSTAYNIGVAWDVTEWFTAKLDYFNIEVEDVISYVGPQSLVAMEQAGFDPVTDTAALYRDANGRIDYVEATYDNLSELSTEGVDLTLNFNWETEYGTIGLDSITSYTMSFDEPSYVGGPVQDFTGFASTPKFKSQFGANWAISDFRFTYTLNHTDSTAEQSSFDTASETFKKSGHLSSWTTHDATATYYSGGYGDVTLSIRNLTNEDPVLDSFGKWADDELYNNLGRVYTLSYSISL